MIYLIFDVSDLDVVVDDAVYDDNDNDNDDDDDAAVYDDAAVISHW